MSVRALQKIQAPSLNCLGRALLAGTLRKTRLLQMGVQATFLSAAQHAPHSLGSLEPRKAAELSQSVSSARLLSSPAAGSTAVRAARTCGKAQRMFSVERSPDANRIESLQRIAGIGPRNSQRLVSAGIDSLTRLRELFRDSNNADKMKMLACSQVPVFQHVLEALLFQPGCLWIYLADNKAVQLRYAP